jgi:UDP-2-acetamido-2-deoxy-ribo-hexuluronate aminotransferase
MSVPFIDLKRFEYDFLNNVTERITRVVTQAQYVGGAEVDELEGQIGSFLEVNHVVTCANGTDALQIALRAVGIKPGDLVLIPNLTFWATFEAVVNVGGIPVTVDADYLDGGVCLNSFEDAARSIKPKAAVIAHLYGWGSRYLGALRALCRQLGIPLIEDGAQSFGSVFEGHSIFKDADVATTSFYPAKVLGGAGDGGAVLTNSRNIASVVRRLSNHGRATHYSFSEVGWNSRLDSIQACYLNISLKHIEQRIHSRRTAANFYRSKISFEGIKFMVPPVQYEENGYLNVALIGESDLKAKIELQLRRSNIGFANVYPSVMSEQPAAAGLTGGHFGGVVAQALCRSVINFPQFPYITQEELQIVVDTIAAIYPED